MPAYGAAKDGMKKEKKVLDHLRVHEGENGGHIVEHHFTSFQHEPEKHIFGPEDGHEALLHIAKHANIQHDLGKATDEHDTEAAEGHDKEEINA